MPHILLICSTFHSISFSSRECGTLQEHSCVRRRWHSSYLYLNLSFMFLQMGILAPPMQPLMSYNQFFLLKVAEFSECSKTNGFSFVMHCRKAKDDMVLFTSLSLSSSILSIIGIFNCYSSSRGFIEASSVSLLQTLFSP